jgi:hypothetical protein
MPRRPPDDGGGAGWWNAPRRRGAGRGGAGPPIGLAGLLEQPAGVPAAARAAPKRPPRGRILVRGVPGRCGTGTNTAAPPESRPCVRRAAGPVIRATVPKRLQHRARSRGRSPGTEECRARRTGQQRPRSKGAAGAAAPSRHSATAADAGGCALPAGGADAGRSARGTAGATRQTREGKMKRSRRSDKRIPSEFQKGPPRHGGDSTPRAGGAREPRWGPNRRSRWCESVCARGRREHFESRVSA